MVNHKVLIISLSIVTVLGLGGGVYYLYQVQQPADTVSTGSVSTPVLKPKTTSTVPSTATPSKSDTPPSTAPTSASTTTISMGGELNKKGEVVKPTTAFSPAIANIYSVLPVKDVTRRTQISYIRYFEGKYVDSRVSHPTKSGIQNFHFQWSLKSGKTRKAGNYTIVFYVNGKKSQSVEYVIR